MRQVPVPGLIIRYDYVWRHEFDAGRTTSKDRPACLMLVVDVKGERRVFILPITHSPPRPEDRAIEIPAVEKRRLGLDDLPSWIIASEVNEDIWPRNLIPIPGRAGEKIYGRLSHPILVKVAAEFQKAVRERALKRTLRL